MLKIKNLNFAYDKELVLKDLNLEVPKASIHGILGMNGSGKTTFFNNLYGNLKKHGGSINYEEQALKNQSIAYLETHNYFYSYMRGSEYLEICSGANKQFDKNRWNKLFKLPLDYLVDSYSTGMKKKLALMGILALDRPILILDEPFNGVDLESNEIIFQLLLRLKKAGKLILISSHIMETLTNICDQISHLQDGQFQKTYERSDFRNMEKELRSQLIEKTENVLDELIP